MSACQRDECHSFNRHGRFQKRKNIRKTRQHTYVSKFLLFSFFNVCEKIVILLFWFHAVRMTVWQHLARGASWYVTSSPWLLGNRSRLCPAATIRHFVSREASNITQIRIKCTDNPEFINECVGVHGEETRLKESAKIVIVTVRMNWNWLGILWVQPGFKFHWTGVEKLYRFAAKINISSGIMDRNTADANLRELADKKVCWQRMASALTNHRKRHSSAWREKRADREKPHYRWPTQISPANAAIFLRKRFPNRQINTLWARDGRRWTLSNVCAETLCRFVTQCENVLKRAHACPLSTPRPGAEPWLSYQLITRACLSLVFWIS